MEFETVRRVSMSDLGLKICWEVYDIYSSERTFLDADPTSYAQAFRYESDFRLRCDLYAELSRSDDRT